MIKKIYYSIWTDLILQLQKNPLNKKNWKWYSLFVMSLCFGFNYVFLLALLPKDLHPIRIFLEFRFFDTIFLDTLIHGLILFLVPGYIIHYFMVFFKGRYKKIICEYKFHDGKLFMKYMLFSLLGPPVILIIALIVTRL
jgi:hypothetical protein